jgi:hypothetical protein
MAAYHHRPGAIGEGAVDILAAVHVADALVETPEGPLDEAFLERAGYLGDLPRWRDIAGKRAEQIASTR